MRLIDRMAPARRDVAERSNIFGVDSIIFNAHRYLLANGLYGPGGSAWPNSEAEAITSNGMVYGLTRKRIEVFSQARLTWRRFGAGPKPMSADVFRDQSLAPLDNPVQILARMELDVACWGNSYWVLSGGVLYRLPPEWVSIVIGTNLDVPDPSLAWDAEVTGIVYQPPGGGKAEVFLPGEYVHYRPEEDPAARFRGMSWVRPAMEDVATANGARRFLTKFFENSATPNLVVKFPTETGLATVKAFADAFTEKHEGVERAFRTAFLGGGADPVVVGSSLKDLDTEHVRTQVYADLCMASGVGPIAAGILPGTFTNTKESNRAFADVKGRYLWLALVDALRPAFTPPSGAELWYDAAGVSALQSDAADDASTLASQAATIRTLVDGGFDPASAVHAVTIGDLAGVQHSGLVSVQLLPPGTGSQGGLP